MTMFTKCEIIASRIFREEGGAAGPLLAPRRQSAPRQDARLLGLRLSFRMSLNLNRIGFGREYRYTRGQISGTPKPWPMQSISNSLRKASLPAMRHNSAGRTSAGGPQIMSMTWVSRAWRRYLWSYSSWQPIAARVEARAVRRALHNVGIDKTQVSYAIPLSRDVFLNLMDYGCVE